MFFDLISIHFTWTVSTKDKIDSLTYYWYDIKQGSADCYQKIDNVLSFTFIECRIHQFDSISDKITISLCLIIPVQLKVKVFIQSLRHCFELTRKSMKWLVNQSCRLGNQTDAVLESNCEGTSAISDEKDALKLSVSKCYCCFMNLARMFLKPLLANLEISLTILRSKFFESRFNFKYFRSCRLAQTVTSIKSSITARIVINNVSWYWNIVRSCTVKSVFQSLS